LKRRAILNDNALFAEGGGGKAALIHHRAVPLPRREPDLYVRRAVAFLRSINLKGETTMSNKNPIKWLGLSSSLVLAASMALVFATKVHAQPEPNGHVLYDPMDEFYYCVGTPVNCDWGKK